MTGSTGMLGRYVMGLLIDQGLSPIAPDRSQCNLINPEAVYSFVKGERPDIVLHLAAETDVDLCERDPTRAGIANHLATDAIARASQEIGAWMLYISTSNVFGGEGKLIYNELDQPSPMNYYGRSKLLGEQSIRLRIPDQHLIIRAGWMIGGGAAHDHKFVGKIVAQIRNRVPEIKAVRDKLGTITSAKLLAELIVSTVLEERKMGTLHFCSEGVTTRFQIAQAMAQYLKFEGRVTGVSSPVFPLSAPRPQSEGIETIYPMSIKVNAGTWQSALSQYLEEFKDVV
ncbi:SDR family oxidoreductase [Bradyrhizobium sp. USDA 4353]